MLVKKTLLWFVVLGLSASVLCSVSRTQAIPSGNHLKTNETLLTAREGFISSENQIAFLRLKANKSYDLYHQKFAGAARSISSVPSGSVIERSGHLKGDILDWAADEYLPRDSNRYRVPAKGDLDIWRQVISAMLLGDLPAAADLVAQIAPSYKVIKFTDVSASPARVYYLLLEAVITSDDILPYAETGWGVYVFDPQPIRKLAISVPHIAADLHTEDEGIEAFVTLRARCLLLSASHRCASDTVSPCAGSSDVCGDGSHHASDASHGSNPADTRVTNTFQVAHEELINLYPATVVIQFHGNGVSACSQVTLSNGGSNHKTISNGNISRLKQSLTNSSITVRVCDQAPVPGECNLCGTTNLQARYINGRTDNPCQNSAPSPNDFERFIHVEQSLTVRETAQKRQTIIQAIANTTFTHPAESSWNCSDGWWVTGYFTPIESEYSGSTRSIFIEEVGTDSFKSDFLDEVQVQGWGRTRYGWYVGHYSGGWHKSNVPLDALGNPLIIGTVATDPPIINLGSTVRIPLLPTPWGSRVYIANDVGPGIQAKEIDVFCGEGISARQEAFRITGNYRVCHR